MQSCIVCCGENGRCVVFGECEQTPVVGETVTLRNARMVLYWPSQCVGLFGLAQNGPKEGLRMTDAVSETSMEVRQWLAVPDEVGEELKKWPVSQ